MKARIIFALTVGMMGMLFIGLIGAVAWWVWYGNFDMVKVKDSRFYRLYIASFILFFVYGLAQFKQEQPEE